MKNILGKCFRTSPSSANPRISPLTAEYECPHLSLFIIRSVSPKHSERIIPNCGIQAEACLKHSSFLKVKGPHITTDELTPSGAARQIPAPAQERGTERRPTTSFLTATTLIYATGAGITAAAGTRLALQWIIANAFALCSFQSPRRSPVLLFLVTTSLS